MSTRQSRPAMIPDGVPSHIRISTAAHALGWGTATLRGHVDRGHLPAKQPSRAYGTRYISPDSLAEFAQIWGASIDWLIVIERDG